MDVTLSERAKVIASQAVASGICASVDDAVERAMELLAAEAQTPVERWTPEYAAEVKRGLAQAASDIEHGRITRADAAFWRRMRSAIPGAGDPGT
jgi:hypothetical protein